MEVLTGSTKILVIQTAFLGDAILTLPMIQELKKKYSNSSIDLVAIPSAAEVFSASPSVNEVIVFDKRDMQKSIISLIKFIKDVRKRNYKIIYSPHRSLRTSLIVYFSKAEQRIGFDTSSMSSVYSIKIKYNPSLHEVARNLELTGFEIKNENWKIKPVINISEETVKKVDSLLKSINKKIIAVAPGSVWNTKKYPVEYFQKVSDYLLSKEYFIALIGGRQDSDLCLSLKKEKENIESFAGKLNVSESIELLKRCSLLISNDSAPTHMGMISGTPTLTIFCSTIAEFGFYPYIQKCDTVSFNELTCKPCGIHGHDKCPIKTFDCGYKLLPEKVIEKIEELLS